MDTYKKKYKEAFEVIREILNSDSDTIEMSKFRLKLQNIFNELKCYTYDNEDIIEFDFAKKYYHKFDIKDAKDGDILADDRVILLFRSIGNRNWKNVISYYVILETNLNNRFSISDDEEYWGKIENCKLKPATKEQRDLLFQKMHEAGYKWDDKKKELQLLITNGDDFDSKDSDRNPAWSENDERHLRGLIGLLEDVSQDNVRNFRIISDNEKDDIEYWLNSLKNRVQSQSKQE